MTNLIINVKNPEKAQNHLKSKIQLMRYFDSLLFGFFFVVLNARMIIKA